MFLKKIDVNNWNERGLTSGLLYFYQVVSELTYDYTIDSFKLPSHNVLTLISETKKTIEHIQDGIISDGVLSSIREELVDFLTKDLVFVEVFGSRIEFIVNGMKGGDSHNFLIILKLVENELSKKYDDIIIRRLRASILSNEYSRILRYSKCLLIQKLHKGNSIKFLEEILDQCFCNDEVVGIANYDDFIQRLNVDVKKFKVIFQVASGFTEARKFLSSEKVKFSEVIDERLISDHPKMKKKDGYVELEVESKDWLKAYSKSQFMLEVLSSHLSFVNHRSSFSVGYHALVDGDGVVAYVDDASNNPLLRRPNARTDKKKAERLISMGSVFTSDEMDSSSKNLLLIAYLKHHSALLSNSYQTQLVDLWSGIEVLASHSNPGSKIENILNDIVPVISSGYFIKIVNYILNRIRKSPVNKNIYTLFKEVGGNNDIDSLFRILMLSKNKEVYDQLVDLLGNNPLLKHKVEYYHSVLSCPKEIKKIYNNHQKRLSWQIRRIYRARNLIVHSGKIPYRLETLIENLHYYFDILLHKITEFSEDSEVDFTMDHFYLRRKFDDAAYLKYLEKNKNKGVDEDSYMRFSDIC